MDAPQKICVVFNEPIIQVRHVKSRLKCQRSVRNITAGDCAEINRKLNEIIEEENIITSSYRLDVSSPGTDRPLLYLKQYLKHIDRKFEVTYNSSDTKKKFKGTLKNINGEQLTFLTDSEIVINFSDIIKATVVISFS